MYFITSVFYCLSFQPANISEYVILNSAILAELTETFQAIKTILPLLLRTHFQEVNQFTEEFSKICKICKFVTSVKSAKSVKL